MEKKPLNDRLRDIKPEGVNFMDDPVQDKPEKGKYLIEITATEKQLDHMKAHMRTIRIPFKVIDEGKYLIEITGGDK